MKMTKKHSPINPSDDINESEIETQEKEPTRDQDSADLTEKTQKEPAPESSQGDDTKENEKPVKKPSKGVLEKVGRQNLTYVLCGVIGGVVAVTALQWLPMGQQNKPEDITVKSVTTEGHIQEPVKSPEEKLKEGINARLKQQTQELEAKAKEKGTTLQEEADRLRKAEQEATEKEAVEKFQEKAKKVSPIQSVVNLPINGMKAILADDGTLMYVTDNGRYAFVGDLIDVWQQKPLETLDEIRASVNTVPVKALGLKPDGLNVLTWGKGKDHVSAFIDPQCGWCHTLIEEIQKDKELAERFRFDLYVVPALGETSDRLARKIWCADASNDEKLSAFMKGAEGIYSLKQKQPGQCPMDGYDQTLMSAQMLGVTGVPFVIAADGRFVAGKPQNIRSFLLPTAQKE